MKKPIEKCTSSGIYSIGYKNYLGIPLFLTRLLIIRVLLKALCASLVHFILGNRYPIVLILEPIR